MVGADLVDDLRRHGSAADSGALVLARHVTACRARMNEALQTLGVPVTPFARQELTGGSFSASDINDVQGRAQ